MQSGGLQKRREAHTQQFSTSRHLTTSSHTPARCQSRRRRQHVIPDPHSSSSGSICKGMPLRRTKTIPVRHARSEIRGRPPCGRRGGIGKNGSTRSYNGSGSSAAITPSRYLTQEIRIQKFCYTLFARRRNNSIDLQENSTTAAVSRWYNSCVFSTRFSADLERGVAYGERNHLSGSAGIGDDRDLWQSRIHRATFSPRHAC